METITVDLSDLYLKLIILHGASIIIGITALLCIFKSKGIPALILTIATFVCYFSANNMYNEKRDKRVATSIQYAGIPVQELLYLDVSGKTTLLTYWSDNTQKQYCFRVIGKYWHTERIVLEQLSKE